MVRTGSRAASIEKLEARAYQIPTDFPEADGTIRWDSTTLVVVHAEAGGKRGLGYTYASRASAQVVTEKLAEALKGRDALDVPAAFEAMLRSVRNLGRGGPTMMAISAVDFALWDLKAKLLDLPLVKLVGQARARVPIYASGGFTSYPIERLQAQLRGWVHQGIPRVKMKVGTDPEADPERVMAAREAIGPATELYVDANGAYRGKQALELAHRFADEDVTWLEEPVSSDDLPGLHLIRERAPSGMQVAAGEYGDTPFYFLRMLQAGAVDVLQADGTRCGGLTGFLHAAALAHAFNVPFSAHCAPALHTAAGACAERIQSLEYFHDHVRIEHLLFDGVPKVREGALEPDLSRPGLGLDFKEADAEQFRI